MIKELAATIMLAGSIGSQPLQNADDLPITAETTGWTHITGSGQQKTIQVLINDGRQHGIDVSTTMAFDEACYYVAGWYDNYVNTYPQYVNSNTRLFGFVYNANGCRTLVFTEYVTAFAANLYMGSMYDYYAEENHTLANVSGLSTSVYYQYYDFSNTSYWGVYDDGEYCYANFRDVYDYQSHVYYVRGNDKFFRTDVITQLTFNGSGWNDADFWFYHDDQYQIGYDAGYSNGKANGRVEGFDAGYSNGYDDGVEAASATTENGVFSVITGAFTSISKFLNFQIAPNITLGLLISVPIVVGIIFVIIKFVKG